MKYENRWTNEAENSKSRIQDISEYSWIFYLLYSVCVCVCLLFFFKYEKANNIRRKLINMNVLCKMCNKIYTETSDLFYL